MESSENEDMKFGQGAANDAQNNHHGSAAVDDRADNDSNGNDNNNNSTENGSDLVFIDIFKRNDVVMVLYKKRTETHLYTVTLVEALEIGDFQFLRSLVSYLITYASHIVPIPPETADDLD